MSAVVQAWPLRWSAAQAMLQLQEQQGAQAGMAQQAAGTRSQPGAGAFWITDPGERPRFLLAQPALLGLPFQHQPVNPIPHTP